VHLGFQSQNKDFWNFSLSSFSGKKKTIFDDDAFLLLLLPREEQRKRRILCWASDFFRADVVVVVLPSFTRSGSNSGSLFVVVERFETELPLLRRRRRRRRRKDDWREHIPVFLVFTRRS